MAYSHCQFQRAEWTPKELLESLSFAFIRQMADGRQRNVLRYQAIKSKWTCCFKTAMHDYSFDTRKKIWNENVQRKFCHENLNLHAVKTLKSLNSLICHQKTVIELTLLESIQLRKCTFVHIYLGCNLGQNPWDHSSQYHKVFEHWQNKLCLPPPIQCCKQRRNNFW
jgi:hypothetical protein